MASNIDSLNKSLTALTKVGALVKSISAIKKAATPQQKQSQKEIDKIVEQRVKEKLASSKEEESLCNLQTIKNLVKAVKLNDYELLSQLTNLSMEDCIKLLKMK